MAVMTLEEANSQFDHAVQFNPLLQWYRNRSTQVAVGASIILHALLIALVPGLRAVSIEPETVLTVRIAGLAPAVEQPVIEQPVVESPVVRKDEPLPPPEFEPMPEFQPTMTQPQALEPIPVRPQQALQPPPVPVVRNVEQVEQLARADLAEPVARDTFRAQPNTVQRPELAPTQAARPVVESRPVAAVARADLAAPVEVARDVSRPRPVTAARPEVTPTQIAAPVTETRPVAPVARADLAAPVEVARDLSRPQPVTTPRPEVTPTQIAAPAIETRPVAAVARPDLVAPVDVARDLSRPQPMTSARPEVAPAQVSAPVINTRPVTPVAPADLVAPAEIARDTNRPQPAIAARPGVAPAQTAVPAIQAKPVEQIDRPNELVTEVRRQPRALPQVGNPVQPQPIAVAPRTVARPVQDREAQVAVPSAPVPSAAVPIARSAPAPAQSAPPTTVAPVQPRPQKAASVVAMPAPKNPVLVVAPEVLEAYRQSVSKEVMRHMSYPRVAVMRKWQGKTVVEMKLSADGEVIQVVVAKSSGKGVLDDAAVKMVQDSLPLPKPPLGVRTVTVPVEFRLRG
jgi:protein TonB